MAIDVDTLKVVRDAWRKTYLGAMPFVDALNLAIKEAEAAQSAASSAMGTVGEQAPPVAARTPDAGEFVLDEEAMRLAFERFKEVASDRRTVCQVAIDEYHRQRNAYRKSRPAPVAADAKLADTAWRDDDNDGTSVSRGLRSDWRSY